MKLSARDQIAGTVAAVTPGAVGGRVSIELMAASIADAGDVLIAQ